MGLFGWLVFAYCLLLTENLYLCLLMEFDIDIGMKNFYYYSVLSGLKI